VSMAPPNTYAQRLANSRIRPEDVCQGSYQPLPEGLPARWLGTCSVCGQITGKNFSRARMARHRKPIHERAGDSA
jgi:hypothetical protein